MGLKFILLFLFTTSCSFFFSSDKQAIKEKIETIEELVEYEHMLPPLKAAVRFGKIREHFSDDFEATYVSEDYEKSIKDWERIKQAALAGSQLFNQIELSTSPSLVSINDNKAQTELVIIITGTDSEGEQFRELFRVQTELMKIDGKWLIVSLLAERETPEN